MSSTTEKFLKPIWPGAALLVAVVLLAYLPALRAGFIWDDEDYVTRNPVIRTADGLERIWFEPSSLPQYYPLVHTTYWIEYHLWELDPFGYHLVNIVLHALGCVLLFAVLRSLEIPLAFLAAALFALHPVHVESVAWITERKNVLAGLFYFLALLAWLRWRPLDRDGSCPVRSPFVYWLALAAFCCALFSKTVTCSLPAVIVLLIWWKRGRLSRKEIVGTLPFFAVGLFMALVTATLEKEHVLAKGADWDFSIVERCLIAGRAVWFYAVKLVWPFDLCFNYTRWTIDSTVWWQYAFPLLLGLTAAALWFLRHRLGRGPLAALLIFAGSLVPALGFFDVYPMVYSFVADHFQYLASVSMIVLVCAIGAVVVRRLASVRARWIPAVCASFLLLVLGTLTWRQCLIYENLETLWTDTIEKNSRSWLALGNLGGMRVDQRQWKEAKGLLTASIAVRDQNPYAHNNLGLVYLETGKYDDARLHLEKALDQRNDYAETHSNYGVLLWRTDDREGAARSFVRAIDLDPTFPTPHRNLADLYLEQGKKNEALPYIQQTLELQPGDCALRIELARILADGERVNEALGQYVLVLRLKPGERTALTEMARLVARAPQASDPRQIVGKSEKAFQTLGNQIPAVLDALAAALAEKRRFAEAAAAERRAIELVQKLGLGQNRADYARRLSDYEKQL